jgi:hypothetical protein
MMEKKDMSPLSVNQQRRSNEVFDTLFTPLRAAVRQFGPYHRKSFVGLMILTLLLDLPDDVRAELIDVIASATRTKA